MMDTVAALAVEDIDVVFVDADTAEVPPVAGNAVVLIAVWDIAVALSVVRENSGVPFAGMRTVGVLAVVTRTAEVPMVQVVAGVAVADVTSAPVEMIPESGMAVSDLHVVAECGSRYT